jgi:hypothetical protein
MQTEARPTGLTIHMEGVFDEPAARRVGELLAGAPMGSTVAIDLSRVRAFHDHGLALLADALSRSSDGRVAVRGLGRHQERLLRYLGVAPSAFDGGKAATALA